MLRRNDLFSSIYDAVPILAAVTAREEMVAKNKRTAERERKIGKKVRCLGNRRREKRRKVKDNRYRTGGREEKGRRRKQSREKKKEEE